MRAAAGERKCLTRVSRQLSMTGIRAMPGLASAMRAGWSDSKSAHIARYCTTGSAIKTPAQTS